MKITNKNIKDIELYYHPKQKENWIEGNDLYQHLKDKNLLEDCLTLENLQEIQALGLEIFNKYFKNKYVYAWKSVRYSNGRLVVPYLVENGGKVVVRWYWLVSYLNSIDPALRFSKSFKLSPSEPLDTLSLDESEIITRLERIEKLLTKHFKE